MTSCCNKGAWRPSNNIPHMCCDIAVFQVAQQFSFSSNTMSLKVVGEFQVVAPMMFLSRVYVHVFYHRNGSLTLRGNATIHSSFSKSTVSKFSANTVGGGRAARTLPLPAFREDPSARTLPRWVGGARTLPRGPFRNFSRFLKQSASRFRARGSAPVAGLCPQVIHRDLPGRWVLIRHLKGQGHSRTASPLVASGVLP